MDRPIMHLLRDVNMAMRAAHRHTLTGLDLTPVQSTVLHLIDANPGSSSAELSRRTHVTPQTMHKIVTELQHRALLALEPRPGHGRILDAHLTEQGRKVVADADARAQAIEDRMTTGLDEQQRQQLVDLLQHCMAALDMPPEDAQPEAVRPGSGRGG